MSDGNETITLTKEQLRELMHETVIDTLTKIGLQADNPIETQKDFQHLRDFRTTTEAVKRKSILMLVGLLFSGIGAAIWLGVKSAMAS